MLVMKFGGTSVGSAATIKQVKEIVKNAMKSNSRIFLVVSANVPHRAMNLSVISLKK
jgi:aspartokinase